MVVYLSLVVNIDLTREMCKLSGCRPFVRFDTILSMARITIFLSARRSGSYGIVFKVGLQCKAFIWTRPWNGWPMHAIKQGLL